MKQINSVIASILVSGLLVLGIGGIGMNALTNTSAASPSTAASVQFNSSNERTGRRFESRSARSTTGTPSNEQNPFTQ